MKKGIILMIVMVVTVFVIITGCGKKQADKEDQSLQYIKDKGTLVLGLDDQFPPMGFRDEDGKIVGFDIDMANEVCKRLGVKLETKPIDWDSKVMNLNNKDIDVIWNGLTITQERKKKIEFSNPYLDNKQIIIVKSDSNIDKKSDLKGKIVGVQMGSSGQEAVEADEKTTKELKELRKYDNFAMALMDLSVGRIDAVVGDEILGRYYIAKKDGEYKIGTENFGSEEYGIGFRKGDIAFKDSVNKILGEMLKDGATAKISEKWFGKNIVK